jgi:flagellar hook-length control protein FliK
MNALTSVLPAAPPAPSAGNATTRPDGDAADTCGFAQCMAQAQQTQAAPSKEDETTTDEAPGDAPADGAATAADAATPPPDLAALLPGWSAVPTVATSEPAPALKTTAGHDGVLALDAKAAKSLAAAEEPSVPQASPAAQAAATAATPAHSPEVALPVPAREATARTPSEPRAATAETTLTPLPTAAAPTAVTTAPARTADSATPTAHLPAPMHTPAFAPALATQVRWWAHDGVQQAQLTLNPPEMGPVAVKIVLHEQREARIDFIADMPATRSALEAALPVLAAALDESGLKLAGGGVHDGAAQRQAPSAVPVTDCPAAGAAALPRPQGARGLVDLVA